MSLKTLPENWDLIVVGGGITGAGVLREATRMGLKALLVEQKDFAWGTSSRSSKLVHGGLRYLKEGKFKLTKIAVEEREYLLKDAPGLVESLGFLLPVYEDQRPGRRALKVGLSLYDVMARERQHKFYDTDEFLEQLPFIRREGLIGGFFYLDAQVDDSRLVLRLMNESVAAGARALNYTKVTELLRDESGQIVGVLIKDTETRETRTLSSRAVINATGCWAEKLHPAPDSRWHLRPLRGSHLVFPADVLPITHGFGFMHPADNRSVFMVPWEGAVLVGTTDLDHHEEIATEPRITEAEVQYLMQGLEAIFPALGISLEDCIAAFAGVRPVLSEDDRSPSEESREHVVWVDKGLITVTGGKLTTFRRLAWDALKAARAFLPDAQLPDRSESIFSKAPDQPHTGYDLPGRTWRRLSGRYGFAAATIVRTASPEDLNEIPGTHTIWAELPFVARNESVRHLDDLLLRRVRIGLLTRHGGKAYLKRVRKLCHDALPWDRRRWKKEIRNYLVLWNRSHALPVQLARAKTDAGFFIFRAIGSFFKFLRNRAGSSKQAGKASPAG